MFAWFPSFTKVLAFPNPVCMAHIMCVLSVLVKTCFCIYWSCKKKLSGGTGPTTPLWGNLNWKYVTSQIHFFLGYSHSTAHHGQVLSPDYLLLKFLFQESQRNFLPNYPKHSDGNKDSKEGFIITVSQNTVLQTLMKKRFN